MSSVGDSGPAPVLSHQDTVVKCTSVPPKALTSDLNDPSVTSDSEEGVGILGSTGTEKCVEGRRSRFLKKAPTSATSSKSPVQRKPEPRYLSSSYHSSQSSALSPLAQTKNRFPRSKHSRHDLEMSVSGTQPAEAATVLSAQFSPDQSLNRRPFLKNTAAGSAVTAFAQRNRSGATFPSDDASVPVGGFSLESDEEDMKRLLEESEGSAHHTVRPGTAALRRTAQKTSYRQSHQVIRSSVASVHHPSLSDPSRPRHSSPFGWTGPAQTPSSPAVLSPSPHRPCTSLSPPESLVSTSRKDYPGGPQRSLSSTSIQQGLSLQELFPVDRQSNNSCSEMSSASTEDFKIHVMGLDDDGPGFTEETREEKLYGSSDAGPSDGLKKEEEVLDYHSDFDPVTWTESGSRQISEHILGEGEEPGSEVRENAVGSGLSYQTTEDHHTGSASDTSPNCSLRTSDRSQNTKASGAMRRHGFTEPHGGCNCGQSLKDPGLGDISNNVPPYVHAFSTSNPSTIVLIEMLKQQLAVTRQFVDRSRRLHCSLVQSLEPPNYKYTSLEDAKTSILKHRTPTMTTENI